MIALCREKQNREGFSAAAEESGATVERICCCDAGLSPLHGNERQKQKICCLRNAWCGAVLIVAFTSLFVSTEEDEEEKIK